MRLTSRKKTESQRTGILTKTVQPNQHIAMPARRLYPKYLSTTVLFFLRQRFGGLFVCWEGVTVS